MRPPESIRFSCSTACEALSASNQAITQLAPEVRQRPTRVMKAYLHAYRLEGVQERFDGRTVARVLAEFQEPTAPPDICSGELDGLRCSLRDARPADEPDATRD